MDYKQALIISKYQILKMKAKRTATEYAALCDARRIQETAKLWDLK